MVVEHDLILLDYLSDFVHLMYGKPGVFGIVSQVKTTREGINTYLEGFSKEENYRFREYEIAFSIRAAAEKKRGTAMAQWPALEKKLGGFSLKVEPNSLSRGEVVGVLGPNGIGKTTFARMLVSEIKPDKGAFETALKISYKPQYIEAPEGKTVEQLFMEEKIDVSLPEIKNSIIRPLDIEMLMQKECSKLSGGELQRAMIALCLARSSDIVLMDEPSANLDVEQRLAVAKAIRSFVDSRGISALIVDHDLLFIDYIADRLMVFDGEPAEHGIAKGPFGMEEGMNMLLKGLGITLRRDMNSKRPRINKQGSQKDMEQKKSGKYYYA
jgi:ATP-binding cassette subfamily E protein 1